MKRAMLATSVCVALSGVVQPPSHAAAPVYPSDLEAWERYAGIKIGSGDALFPRTGLHRWDFLLTAAAVPVLGGTGFSLNPIATF